MMNNIKYAVDGIIKKVFIFLIIVLQITMCTILILPTISTSLKLSDSYYRSKELYKDKNIYKVISPSYDKDKEYDKETLLSKKSELYKWLIDNNNFKFCIQSNTSIYIKDFCSDDKFYYDIGEYKYITNPFTNIYGNYSNINCIYINDKYSENFVIDTSEGRGFEKSDFSENEIIPIILGYNYKNIYKVGDTFKYFDFLDKKVKTLKVVGITKSSIYFYNSGDIESFDNKIIVPLRSSNLSLDMYMLELGQFYIISNDYKQSIIDIRQKTSELGLDNYNIYDLKEDIQSYIDGLEEDLKSQLTLTITIILFVSIGITATQLNNIKEQLREYGIHLLCGADKKDIVKRNIYSVFLYIFIGFLIGIYFEYYKNMYKDGYYYDYRTILVLAGIYAILILIISFILYRKIRKIEVNDIIRGLSDGNNKDK